MPINLVSGLPRNGKTLYTLWRIKHEAEKEHRPVFHNDIPGLNIPGWQVWKVEEWEKLPAGAIFVIDECQKAFPVRGRDRPPEWIENLSTHGHLGLDFWIISQDPMLFDTFVRRLVQRHYHVIRKFGTNFATIHEFPTGVRENVSKTRKDSIRHEWRYPKEVFGWYTSSEMHTVKVAIPAKVWLLFFTVVALVVLVAVIAYRLTHREPVDQQTPVQTMVMPDKLPPSSRSVSPEIERAPFVDASMTPAQYIEAYQPRVPGLLHTAAAYDHLTKPNVAPVPVGCMASKSRCACFTQQGTQYDAPESMCRDFVRKGWFQAFPIAANSVQPLAKSQQ